MRRFWLATLAVALWLTAILALSWARPVEAQASLTGTYTQDFNTLALVTSSTVPPGWAFLETGTNANATYAAGTGSSATGNTYSFGAASNSERAFGTLLSGSLTSVIGAQFQNDSSKIIGSVDITYTCEQWRLGATGRFDRLDFEYSLNATSLNTGTWVAVDALDCWAAISTGTASALDGNTNNTVSTGSITGLSIGNGGTFWVRWKDADVASADDGLGIDDFQMLLYTPSAVTLQSLSANSAATGVAWLIGLGVCGAGAAIVFRRLRRRA